MFGKKILIIDADLQSATTLQFALEAKGSTVYHSSSGVEALGLAPQIEPDLIIMELSLSDHDGIELCEKFRGIFKQYRPFIIFTSIRSENYAQIAAYRAGADDFLPKPLNLKVMAEKLEVMLSRTQLMSSTHSNVSISLNGYQTVKINDERFVLPRKEFELIKLLYNNPQKVFKREEILKQVWANKTTNSRVIDVYILKIRSKLGNQIIQTVKGIGYRFNQQVSI